MNIFPSSQENSKVSSSSCEASGKMTDCIQSAMVGSSNPNTNSEKDITETHDNTFASHAEKRAQKEIGTIPDKLPSPSTDGTKNLVTNASTAEKDAKVNTDRDSPESGVADTKCIAKEDSVDSTKEKPETVLNTLSESTTTDDNSKQNRNVDLKISDRDDGGVKESIAKAETAEVPKKRTRKKWKKPVGKPNRPLSAYNLYFRKERAIMLGDAAEKIESEPGKKRVHRKTHGKIGFAEMARIIGAKWKALPEEEKEEFVKVAVVEKERYAKDLANWREEQKKKAIINSMGPGLRSKIGKGTGIGRRSDDDDDLVQAIAEDRENLLRQHQAFRMQMMQEMNIGHLGRHPSEGHGRQMPTIEYLRNMPDDRTGPFFGRNRTGTSPSLLSHYPNAAEGSGRDLYQQMMAMTSVSDGQGHARMQMMNGSLTDSSVGPSMGGSMGTMEGTMGGSMGNPMGPSVGAPMRNNMGSSMGNNNMGNTMGMIPINNSASHMPNSAHHSHYEMERFQHMRYQNQMVGMNNNQGPMGSNAPLRTDGQRGASDMASHERSRNNNMEATMNRFNQHSRFN